MRRLLLVGCAALALGAGAAAMAQQNVRNNETFRMLELFGDVLAVVKQAYVVPVDDRKLIEASLSGMMTALDPHSSYLAPAGFGELPGAGSPQDGGETEQIRENLEPLAALDSSSRGADPGRRIPKPAMQTIITFPVVTTPCNSESV